MTPSDEKNFDPLYSEVRPRRKSRQWRGALATLLLLGSATLLGVTLRRAVRSDSINTVSDVTPFADAGERTARLRDVLGRFATGGAPGDRVIVVLADGSVRFEVLGPLQRPLELVDRYTVGQRKGHTCLVTRESGTIEAVDIDHLSYCANTFERTK